MFGEVQTVETRFRHAKFFHEKLGIPIPAGGEGVVSISMGNSAPPASSWCQKMILGLMDCSWVWNGKEEGLERGRG